MLKKTFIRLILLGTIAVAMFFIIIALQKPYSGEVQEPATSSRDGNSPTEFIFESMVGTMLIEAH